MAVDSLWSKVVALLPFSESLMEVRIRNSAIAFGTAALSSSVGTPFGAGKAAYFNGSGAFIRSQNRYSFSLGSGDFCVETWVYPTSLPGGGQTNDMILLYMPGTPQVLFYLDNTTGKPTLSNGTNVYVGANAVSLNAWQYVWCKRTGTTLTIGIGETVGITQASYTTNFAGTEFNIGGTSGSKYLYGYLSNMRITVGADRTVSLPTAPFPRPVVSGHIYDADSQPASKAVFFRNRLTQSYAGGCVSSSVDGLYEFFPFDYSELQVTKLDELCDPHTQETEFNLDPNIAVSNVLVDTSRNRPIRLIGPTVASDGSYISFSGTYNACSSSSSAFVLGTEDFSIEIEFKLIAGSNGSISSKILQLGPNATSGSLFINCVGSTNPAQIETRFYDTAYRQLGGPNTTTLANNVWHQLQLRRVNGVFTTTINGTTWRTSASTSYNISASYLAIGANTTDEESLYGYVRRVRFSRGPRRAASEVPVSNFLKMPTDGLTGENAQIYDRVVPGG